MAPGRRGGSPSKENNSLLFFSFLLIFFPLKQIEAYSSRCVVEKKKVKRTEFLCLKAMPQKKQRRDFFPP